MESSRAAEWAFKRSRNSASGCTLARSRSHASRGMTQVRRSSLNSVAQQPKTDVDAGLARPDDDEALVAGRGLGQRVGSYALDAVGNVVRRRTHRRNHCLQIRRIDNALPYVDGELGPGEITYPAVAQVLTHREVRHPPGRQEFLLHDVVEVRTNIAAGCQLVQSFVPPHPVDGAGFELARVDAVVRRWLVQTHERIGARPVPTGLVTPVDDHQVGVAFGHHGVGEGHTHGARADDQVVRFDHSNGTISNTRPLSAGR